VISWTGSAGIAFADLYLGATVNVYSRELVVVDYGDEFTKGQLEQKKEKTLALIKPDAFLKVGKVCPPRPSFYTHMRHTGVGQTRLLALCAVLSRLVDHKGDICVVWAKPFVPTHTWS
jgi:hypothetical protein